MAIAACVRRAQLYRQVRPRNAEAVISTLIDNHICPSWHVTFDALRARRSWFVKMMLRRIVLLCGMALHTKVVAGGTKLETMRFVTIAAGHPGMEHPALDERAVFVVLLFYLPIGEVMIFIEQRHAVVVTYGLAVHIVFMNLTAPCVASRAHKYFAL